MKANCSASRSGLRARLFLTLLAMAAALPAFADSGAKASGTFYGDRQTVGSGTARSYVALQDGVPVEIGFEVTEEAIKTLPSAEKWHPGVHPHVFTEFLLPLPKEAEATPFKVLELDWNPGGHEPPGIYDTPHFDFHFYTIALEQRNAIDPSDAEYTKKAELLPVDDMVPAGYFTPRPITPFPRMGVHWANQDAEELHGKPFTKTFIYGTWQGRMIFYEPMIAKSFLETKPDVSAPISAAKCYEPAGYHPTTYRVRHDSESHSYRVSLGDFQYRGCELEKKTASNVEAQPKK